MKLQETKQGKVVTLFQFLKRDKFTVPTSQFLYERDGARVKDMV